MKLNDIFSQDEGRWCSQEYPKTFCSCQYDFYRAGLFAITCSLKMTPISPIHTQKKICPFGGPFSYWYVLLVSDFLTNINNGLKLWESTAGRERNECSVPSSIFRSLHYYTCSTNFSSDITSNMNICLFNHTGGKYISENTAWLARSAGALDSKVLLNLMLAHLGNFNLKIYANGKAR